MPEPECECANREQCMHAISNALVMDSNAVSRCTPGGANGAHTLARDTNNTLINNIYSSCTYIYKASGDV